MRLLQWNTPTQISLTEDFSDHVPPYAILSHTWASDDREEVTFDDLRNGQGKSKTGYIKIQFCGERARRDGIEYFWVDTCCINKANLSELSEAITSMFRWYQQAEKCYVYLFDVSARKRDCHRESKPAWLSAFQTSRWFRRGWTLQELLAPKTVEFFSWEREYIGDKKKLAQHIHEITGIPLDALHGTPLSHFSVTERMRWIQGRATKKEEDQAYCLLGIFDVSMPLIYGEKEKAFIRLMEEISKVPKAVSMLKVVEGATFNAYSQVHRGCHPATRVDLLRLIQDWAQRPGGKSIFWLNGMAGTGKSTISWTTAQWLVDQSLAINVTLGASFFFKRGEGDRASAALLFPTIAAQLATKIKHFDVLVAQAINAEPQICSKSLAEQFDKLIRGPLRQMKSDPTHRIYVVVLDALDECENESDIRIVLQLWSSLAHTGSTCLRLFLTSRPELVIRLGFKKMSIDLHQDVILHEVPQPVMQHDI